SRQLFQRRQQPPEIEYKDQCCQTNQCAADTNVEAGRLKNLRPHAICSCGIDDRDGAAQTTTICLCAINDSKPFTLANTILMPRRFYRAQSVFTTLDQTNGGVGRST